MLKSLLPLFPPPDPDGDVQPWVAVCKPVQGYWPHSHTPWCWCRPASIRVTNLDTQQSLERKVVEACRLDG